MVFEDIKRIGKKVVGAVKTAVRIGKKVHHFFTGGSRVGGKTTKAQDLDPSAKSFSSEQFKPKQEAPAQSTPPPAPPPPPKPKPKKKSRMERNREPTPLPKAKGVQVVRSGVRALQEGAKLRDKPPTSLAEIKDEKRRIRNIAEAPSKKQFEKVARQNRKKQRALIREQQKRTKTKRR